jgi:hypothetical protein
MSRNRLKVLIEALPINTGDAKRLIIEETGINYYRFNRMLKNPEYRISASDTILLSNFFSVEIKELFESNRSIKDLVKEIMVNSESIKSLIKYDEQKMVGSSNIDDQGRSNNASKRSATRVTA